MIGRLRRALAGWLKVNLRLGPAAGALTRAFLRQGRPMLGMAHAVASAARPVAPRPAGTRQHVLAAAALLLFGFGSVLVGGAAYAYSWYASWAWAQSPESELAERRAESPSPLFIDEPATAVADARASGVANPLSPGQARGERSQASGQPPRPSMLQAPDRQREPLFGPPLPTAESATIRLPPARAAAEEIELSEVDFRFFDPPEPGATARLALVLRSRAELPSAPVSLAVSNRWFGGFQVFGAIPDVVGDRVEEDGYRYFDFPGLAPGEQAELELHVTASDDEVDAPEIAVRLLGGGEIGRARPRTVAPRPRPGPAKLVDIPRLGIRSGVVPIAWEPPPFVVGQLQGSASVSEGNTVLIGHLRGPTGDVFNHLDRLRPGDDVVAVSRGLEYRFTVSETAVRAFDDHVPMQPTDTPRLTLMTCTGSWIPWRNDYSHRLWVIAEPPELARETIARNAERAEQAAREAAEAAAQRTAHEAAVRATNTAYQDDLTRQELAAATATASAVEEAERPADTPEPPATLRPTAAPTEVPPTATPVPPPAPAAIPRGAAKPDAAPAKPDAAPARPATTVRAVPAPLGLEFRAPTAGAVIPRRVAVRGVRKQPARPAAHVWLMVRADVPGSRWYVYGQEIDVRRDGTWEVELDVGGPPNVRHELLVGVADDQAHAELLAHVNGTPGEPILDVPGGFLPENTVTVIRR